MKKFITCVFVVIISFASLLVNSKILEKEVIVETKETEIKSHQKVKYTKEEVKKILIETCDKKKVSVAVCVIVLSV